MEWRPSMLKMVEFVDDHPVDNSPRRKYQDRADKLINDEKSKVDWFAIKMTEYSIQFWLDFYRTFEKCGPVCLNIGFNYDAEVAIAQKYKEKLGEPFPVAE